MRPYPRFACGIALAAFAWVAAATKMDVPAADTAFDIRLKTLESELRCLVCQNQTLADSNAMLAEDLRRGDGFGGLCEEITVRVEKDL